MLQKNKCKEPFEIFHHFKFFNKCDNTKLNLYQKRFNFKIMHYQTKFLTKDKKKHKIKPCKNTIKSRK